MNRAFTAVLFDLDGTLVDSLGDFHQAANMMLKMLHRPSVTPDMVRGFIGNGQTAFVMRCLSAGGTPATSREVTEASRVFAEQYDQISGQFSAPYPGVADLLAALAAAGKKLAVCTNRPEARAVGILGDAGLAGYFDAVVGFESAEAPKPSPKPLLAALSKLGVESADALYVGDGPVDAEAAAGAGLGFLFHDQGYGRLRPSDKTLLTFSSYASLRADLGV